MKKILGALLLVLVLPAIAGAFTPQYDESRFAPQYIGIIMKEDGSQFTEAFPTIEEAAVAAAMAQYGLEQPPSGRFEASLVSGFKRLYAAAWFHGPWGDYPVYVFRK